MRLDFLIERRNVFVAPVVGELCEAQAFEHCGALFGAVFLTWAAGAQSCKASRRAAGVSNFIFGLCSVALFTKEF